MPTYDWDTFKRYHGGINGARFCFEDLMEELLRLKNPDQYVQGVKLSQGDGGIDILVGNIGIEDIEVYQCKYFDDKLESGQWQQITKSFNTAKNNPKYTMKKWVFCIPKELTLDENIKWIKWADEHKDESVVIQLMSGNEILDNLESFGLCNKYFQNELPKFISDLPRSSMTYICRENDVNELKSLLFNNDNILVNGLGGYGKTSLAILLFDEIKKDYDHVGWIQYEGNLIDSILNSLTIFEEIERDKRIDLICDFLRQQDMRTILFIDDINEKFEYDEFAIMLDGCVKMVVTSRINRLENYKCFPIRTESIEECIKIFSLYYGSSEETETLSELIRYLEYNPLLIELAAKTARLVEMSLNQYVHIIVNDGYWNAEDKVYSKYDNKTDTILNRIKQLYNIQKIDENKKKILQNFALTPNVLLPFEFREWAQLEKDEVNKLINLGWINKTELYYSMHPLIKESILQQESISIDTFNDLLENMNDIDFWNLQDGYKTNAIKLQIARSIIDYFLSACYEKIKYLVKNYSNICNIFSNYKEAHFVLKQLLHLYEENEPDNLEMLINVNLSLAFSYVHAGQLSISKEYLSIADNLANKLDKIDDLFSLYNLHIIIEFNQGNAVKAKEYFDKICELELDEFDFLTAVSNLTSGLLDCEKTDLALEYMEKYKNRIEECFKENEVYLATFYSNLAIAYSQSNIYDKALHYDEKALEIRKRVLGTINKDLAITYLSLADDYIKFHNIKKAKKYILEAENICKKIFDDTDSLLYHNVIAAKNSLLQSYGNLIEG